MKVVKFTASWFEVQNGASVEKFQAGSFYPVTDETKIHVARGIAEEVDAPADPEKAIAAADDATAKAEKAAAAATAAQAAARAAAAAASAATAANAAATQGAK